ncbi:MFS transporter [Pontiella sulfatireligans]|uniref:Putative symporter YjmB n=1 Tax=Pontiella sulfatireligans TaxID=2750658 RepID=A0A6C2UDS3_9BACT|nr:MFS transporter [Pontiella sulfatireligans]VGO18362.1 putative symporter YjmB [Pontiella sulfatireligans]
MRKNPAEHYQTADADKVPVASKLIYAQGHLLSVIGNHVVMEMAGIILNVNLFVRPSLVGLAGTIFRLWSAFADPVVGNLSDNSRSTYGRRRPFIVLGALLCGFTFPLIWQVRREWGEFQVFSYFLVSSLIFYTAYAIFSVPYNTLAMEMSPDYHEKTRIMAWREMVGKTSFILVGWLFFFTESFKDPVSGMRWVSLGLAVLFIASGVLPGLFIKERFYKAASRQKKIPLRESLKATLSSGSFRMVMGMVVLTLIGSWSANYFGRYINIYYIFEGDTHAASVIEGWMRTAEMGAAVASIPMFTWLSRRFGKLSALKVNAGIVVFAALSRFVLVNPAHPWGMVANAALTGPGGTGVWIILGSLVADICDEDELKTGCRREGSYTSVLQLAITLGFSIAYLLSNIVLEQTGFDARLGSAQSASALTLMRGIYILLPPIAMIGMFWIISRYQLDEARCHAIRLELEQRRGKL